MKKVKIMKLYKGLVDLKDYDVDKCIEKKESMHITHGKDSMILTWEQLSELRVYTSKEFPSRTGGKSYKLYSYNWNPKITMQ